MPTNRKRTPRSRVVIPEIENWKIDFLLTGVMRCSSPAAFNFEFDARKQFEAWLKIKNDILKKWIIEKPGSRPWVWWKFDASEMREKLSFGGTSNAELEEMEAGSTFGISDYYDDPYNIQNEKPVFESQSAFLKRHGLLTKAEEKRLKPRDFEPEVLKID